MSGIYDDLIIWNVKPGFCCSVSCIFFHYEPFHKPIQGCKGYEHFVNIENKEDTYDPKFKLHHFMDFASNEKWKCFAKNCPINWSEPFHSQGDKRCIQFPKFCDYFNIPSNSEQKEETKQPNTISNAENEDDVPPLTDEIDSDFSDSDIDEETFTIIRKIYTKPNVLSEPNRTGKINISEEKQAYDRSLYNETLQTDKPSKQQMNIPRRCECHGKGGKSKCVQLCPCKKNGVPCHSCFPMEKGNCRNILPTARKKLDSMINKSEFDSQVPLSFAQNKMFQAFGTTMLNSDGAPRLDLWDKIWERVIRLRGKQYRLPGGALGRQFASMYACEINSLAKGEKKSEIAVCFIPLMLQKDKSFSKTADIRRLISRRMRMWTDGLFETLIQEAEACDKKLPKNGTNMTEDQAIKIFSRLMLEGKIRSATRFLTERTEGGGVMDPNESAGKPQGKSVMEVLLSKHPDQQIPDEEAFIQCKELPIFLDVEITASHIYRKSST